MSGTRIFRKPLASCLSVWLTYLSCYAAQTAKEKLTELLDSHFKMAFQRK